MTTYMIFFSFGLLLGAYAMALLFRPRDIDAKPETKPCKVHSWVYIVDQGDMICEVCHKTPTTLLDEHKSNSEGMY